MGGSQSNQDDIPFDLPQQQIVSVVDGQAAPTTSVRHSDSSASSSVRVGTSKHARAVRAPISVPRGGLRITSHGAVVLEVNATVAGVVRLLAPALEFTCSASTSASFGYAASASTFSESDVSWPTVIVDGDSLVNSRQVPPGEKHEVRFDRPGEELRESHRQDAAALLRDDGSRQWPLVLVMLPCVATSPENIGGMDNPPDGSLMLLCVVEKRELRVARRLIAWGGNGAAYEMKELFGIQEVQQTGKASDSADTLEAENQTKCVVCLTAPKNTALQPCGHYCVCYDCGASIRLSPMRNRCPLCRQDVHDIMQIEVSSRDDNVSANAAPPAAAEPAQRAANEERVASAGATLRSDETSSGYQDSATASTEPSASSQNEMPPPLPQASETSQTGATMGLPSTEALRAARLQALERRGLAGGGYSAAAAPSDSPAVVGSGVVPAQSPAAAVSTTASAEGGGAGPPVPATIPSASGNETVLPPKCLQRLTREMRQMEAQRAKILTEHGIALALCDPEGNDLRAWSLSINADAVDASCELGKQLRRYNIPAIMFEVWIPGTFPVEPPKVRVLKPTFSVGSFWVLQYGALCLEILTRQGWSPAMSLVQLGVQLKAMMSQGTGSINSPAAMAGSSKSERSRAWELSAKVEDVHKDWDKFKT